MPCGGRCCCIDLMSPSSLSTDLFGVLSSNHQAWTKYSNWLHKDSTPKPANRGGKGASNALSSYRVNFYMIMYPDSSAATLRSWNSRVRIMLDYNNIKKYTSPWKNSSFFFYFVTTIRFQPSQFNVNLTKWAKGSQSRWGSCIWIPQIYRRHHGDCRFLDAGALGVDPTFYIISWKGLTGTRRWWMN